jgi:hypothetical protein
MGEGVPLSHALPPLPPVAKIMGKTFRYIRYSHPAGMILIISFPCSPGSPLPAEGL